MSVTFNFYRRLSVSLAIAIVVCSSNSLRSQELAPQSDSALKKWLKKFPDADSNQDGKLTESEAREFRKSNKTAKATKRSEPDPNQTPTKGDVAYGPHERQRIDFWQANSDWPTPVLIFFHGGSFKAGDKSAMLQRSTLADCLHAGISVVSANYRFSTDSPFPTPMLDGARSVQFVRSMAHAWKIDPERIALSGSSAGATMALWIALHDDLADPKSPDPIARNSTRVRCASPHSGTASVEPSYFKQHAGVTQLRGAILELFGADSQSELEQPEKLVLVREASPLTHADASDPPLFLTYAGDPDEAPFSPEASQKNWIHHVCLGLPLKSKYDELKLPCDLYYKTKPEARNAEVDFLKKHLIH